MSFLLIILPFAVVAASTRMRVFALSTSDSCLEVAFIDLETWIDLASTALRLSFNEVAFIDAAVLKLNESLIFSDLLDGVPKKVRAEEGTRSRSRSP